MGSRLDELIAKATAKKADAQKVVQSKTTQHAAPTYEPHKTKAESQSASETNMFDNLEEFMDGLNTSAIPPETDYAPDGFQVGDPVVGIHKGQRLAGQVINVDRDDITVEWKNHDVTQVKADTLELSNVDDDYVEQTQYIESREQNLGFDKESFNEDSDLHSLLSGRDESAGSNGLGFKYGDLDDL